MSGGRVRAALVPLRGRAGRLQGPSQPPSASPSPRSRCSCGRTTAAGGRRRMACAARSCPCPARRPHHGISSEGATIVRSSTFCVPAVLRSATIGRIGPTSSHAAASPRMGRRCYCEGGPGRNGPLTNATRSRKPMIVAPIPVDDADRLAALHALGLLDTPPEERFDRITRLLTLVLRVPMAYISLVDSDRQWFKSSCGLDSTETPRSVSFCGHAILSDEPMVVPDAAEDERFHDNPLVTGDPYIRFYAGHPLNGPGGQKVGTLCVADRRPRCLDESELEALSEMARVVERELGLVEAVHLQRDLIRAEQRATEAEHRRAESLGRLVESQRQLLNELTQASKYVRSLLPEPLDGPVRARWKFEPSSQLGGDFFGYDWIDPDSLAIYLLDVSGHGVGAALLSVSVANALRGRALPDTDFRDPDAVLSRLNDAFPMERHDGKYFTIWYGVFDRASRRLAYASAGHPPALLLTGPAPGHARPVALGRGGLAIGMLPGVPFRGGSVSLEPYSKLYVFSDGVYEIHRPGGSMMRLDELLDYLSSPPGPRDPEAVWRYIRSEAEAEPLKDDFSFLEIQFD